MAYIPRKKTQSVMVKHLLASIDLWLTYNSAATDELIGWKGIGDSTAVRRLRAGGDVTTSKYEDLRDFLISPPQGFLPLKTKEQ